MISSQEDGRAGFLQFKKCFNDFAGRGAAIDIIAEKDDLVFAGGAYKLEEIRQRGIAPVNISYGQSAHLSNQLRLLDDRGNQKLSDLAEKGIIQRVGSVGMPMIVLIAEFRCIGPHERGNILRPEWSMIAASENGEMFFEAQSDLQSCDRQLRCIRRCVTEHGIQNAIGTAVGEQ